MVTASASSPDTTNRQNALIEAALSWHDESTSSAARASGGRRLLLGPALCQGHDLQETYANHRRLRHETPVLRGVLREPPLRRAKKVHLRPNHCGEGGELLSSENARLAAHAERLRRGLARSNEFGEARPLERVNGSAFGGFFIRSVQGGVRHLAVGVARIAVCDAPVGVRALRRGAESLGGGHASCRCSDKLAASGSLWHYSS